MDNQSLPQELYDKVINEFLSNFKENEQKLLNFQLKRTDKKGRNIFVTTLSSEFGILTPVLQTVCFILKIKFYEDNNKMEKINFDFMFEMFAKNGLRVSSPFIFYVYDVSTKILKEYKH